MVKTKINQDGYVYFIRDGLGHIKIGKTTDLKKRLDTLQTANPMKLEFWYGIHFQTLKEAEEVEESFHNLFADYRLQGEWFSEEYVMEFLRSDKVIVGDYEAEGVRW